MNTGAKAIGMFVPRAAHAMQQTSLLALLSVKPELGSRQQAVLSEIKEQSMTNAEIAASLHLPINSVTPRMNELVKKGIAKKDRVRECRVTGFRAIAWRAE